ncbi:MAG: hypothetical protein U5K79_08790 [Cyclobacteriaceae bacterium]|nr:hypothetical protein [Cyclobacteriaceae bacterium]
MDSLHSLSQYQVSETKSKKADVTLEKSEAESLRWLFTDFVNVVYPGDFEAVDGGSKTDYTNPQEVDDCSELLARNNSGYYTHVWKCLNSAEKLVMFDLEKNSIINTSNQTVVEGMLRKGLLKDTDEKLQLSDIGWTAFLKGNDQLSEFKQLKQSLRLSGNWHNWRLIIFAVILALCVLFYSFLIKNFSTAECVFIGYCSGPDTIAIQII